MEDAFFWYDKVGGVTNGHSVIDVCDQPENYSFVSLPPHISLILGKKLDFKTGS